MDVTDHKVGVPDRHVRLDGVDRLHLRLARVQEEMRWNKAASSSGVDVILPKMTLICTVARDSGTFHPIHTAAEYHWGRSGSSTNPVSRPESRNSLEPTAFLLLLSSTGDRLAIFLRVVGGNLARPAK